jgi:two-component system, OmpR family, response regulator CpxR
MSHPKRAILLVEPDETEQSVLACVLEAHAFKVLRPADPLSRSQCAALARGADVAVLSNRPPQLDAGGLAHKLRQVRRNLPVLILSDKAEPAFPSASMTVDRAACSMADLIDRLLTLAARRCGPKHGFRRPPSPVG